jgi:hypothetical protein
MGLFKTGIGLATVWLSSQLVLVDEGRATHEQAEEFLRQLSRPLSEEATEPHGGNLRLPG